MVTKVVGCAVKVIAVVFTTVMAPVLVSLTVRDLQREDARPCPEVRKPLPKKEAPRLASDSRPAQPPSPQVVQAHRPQCQPGAKPASSPQPLETIQIIVQGVGRTPGEASQDALRTAVGQALAAQVDAETWARSGRAILDVVLRNCGGIILSWKELKATKEWKLTGPWHHREVAVTLDRRALVGRLRAVLVPGESHSPPGVETRRSAGAVKSVRKKRGQDL